MPLYCDILQRFREQNPDFTMEKQWRNIGEYTEKTEREQRRICLLDHVIDRNAQPQSDLL